MGGFECLNSILHLAYKLPIKKWQARGSDKEIVANNKSRIQKEFKEKYCLCCVVTRKLRFSLCYNKTR